ncbi:hypothetical protein WR25_13266 isoform A [Diploscapter pachys]|uniref:TRIP4/RQT4 C2HC5-type zinc finger domain-containing protein n=1 Tax=Diploscapter pachys TaxID=2018661 RepID=A0A2A2LWP5_9BILA|nr:hypothetical protein WR25_13266 isoform A [Diploscapter pachys]
MAYVKISHQARFIQGRINALAAKLEFTLGNQILPGRHKCSCQARRHKLIMNCMGCGKIVCEQEGSGPCFFCGTLVVTNDEREVLDRGSKKSLELMAKLHGVRFDSKDKEMNLAKLEAQLQNAKEFRDKLLVADADIEKRTKVNDLESDYSSLERNPFLSQQELFEIRARRDELRRIREARKKAVMISLNLNADDQNTVVVEQKQDLSETDPLLDPVISRIIEKSDERRKAVEAASIGANDARWTPQGFVPKYTPPVKGCSAMMSKNQLICENADTTSLVAMSEELQAIEVEQRGYTIALPQPIASLLANGIIREVRWSEDLMLKGPLFIASTVKSATEKDIKDAENEYKKGKFSDVLIDYSAGSLLGRAYLKEILSVEEYKDEYGKVVPLGEGGFVLCFSSIQPLTTSIPHIPPSLFYQLDKQLKESLLKVAF